MSGAAPPFPGATALTRLRVYDSESPDGLRGGTPHMHLVSTEAYVVLGGRGSVQTLGPRGFREIPLEPGGMLWFTPGTIHRLINSDGALEILVIMQNAGLPEAGDMVLTFPPDVLVDDSLYKDAATLPPGEATAAGSGTSARARRDRAVEGFLSLRAATETGDATALDSFYNAAARLVRGRISEWRTLCNRGPGALVDETRAHLDALERGDASHLGTAGVYVSAPPRADALMGCCGTLQPYTPHAD